MRNRAMLDQSLRLTEVIRVLVDSGLTVCSAKLDGLTNPQITVICSPRCWALCATGQAEYYTVGTELDLINYRIGSFSIDGVRVAWQEWGDDIDAADEYLKRSKDYVDAMGNGEGAGNGNGKDACVQ